MSSKGHDRSLPVYRAGFTLVELLLVILIIGMLLALLFPAVNAARETGRQISCLNKMNELAKNVIDYSEKSQRYPGWREVLEARASNGTQPQIWYPISWSTAMTPYFGRNDVWDGFSAPTYTAPTTVVAPTPALHDKLVCPSDTFALYATTPELSYVGNCGRVDAAAPGNSPRDWRANAVFLDMLGYDPLTFQYPANRTTPWPNDPNLKADSSFIQKNDGLSQTLLLSENLDATTWPAMGEAANGFLFWPPAANGSPPNPMVRINGIANGFAPPARPSSNHRQGVNVVFCGGNGKFLSENIQYNVYCALMTPAGRRATEPGTQNPSSQQIRNPPDLVGKY